MKLSDTQHLILSSASQRTDHAVVLPANLKGGAAKKVIDKLLNEKLLQELRTKDEMPVWRRGEDNRAYSLRITKAGLRAIEVEDGAATPDDSPVAHPVEAGVEKVLAEAKSSVQSSRTRRQGVKKKAVGVSAKATQSPSNRTRPDSKQDRIVVLLRRPEGATLDVCARVSRRHGAKETEAPPPLREDRRCSNLSDRCGKERQDQKGLSGAQGLIDAR